MNGASFRRALRVATLCAVAALAACGWSENKPKFQASDITGVDWGKDFHLVDVNGTSRSLAHYRGKVVMVFFGYTNCPDACPTTLAKMAQAVDRLGADGQRVQGLFVTLDPARDTPVWVDAIVHDLTLLLSEPSASDQQATRAGTRISTNAP